MLTDLADGGSSKRTPRPDARGSAYAYDAGAQTRVWKSQRAAVHWVVTKGRDAPSLTSRDGDAVPDYVQRVGRAADRALAYFQRRGFRAPRDRRPDIYLQGLLDDEGVEGLAIGAFDAVGGAFVLVDSRFKARRTKLNDLERTVAHELFHLVQYEYVPSYRLPRWIAEGAAEAVAAAAVGNTQATYWEAVDRWLHSIDRSLFDEADRDCLRCYTGVFYWINTLLETGGPPPLQRFYAKLGSEGLPPDVVGYLVLMQEALTEAGYPSLAMFFGNFARELFLSGVGLNVHREIVLETPSQRVADTIAGMAINIVRIQVPPGTRELLVGVVCEASDSVLTAQLLIGRRLDGNRPRAIPVERTDRESEPGKQIFYFRVAYADDWERLNQTLIVARTSSVSKAYEITLSMS